MKFSLIATLVVLALAQGSLAQDMPDLQRLQQFFEDMKAKVTTDLTEMVRTHDIANQAQTFLEDKKTQFEPLAAQLQEQMQSVATSVQEQLQPLAASVQEQAQPMVTEFTAQMQAFLAQLTEQARAIGN